LGSERDDLLEHLERYRYITLRAMVMPEGMRPDIEARAALDGVSRVAISIAADSAGLMSRTNDLPNRDSLFVMQRLNRVQPGGLHRRVDTRHQPDDDGDEKGERQRAAGHDRGPARKTGDDA